MANSLTSSSLTLGIGNATNIISTFGSNLITVFQTSRSTSFTRTSSSTVTLPSVSGIGGTAIAAYFRTGNETVNLRLPASGSYLYSYKGDNSSDRPSSLSIDLTSSSSIKAGGALVSDTGQWYKGCFYLRIS